MSGTWMVLGCGAALGAMLMTGSAGAASDPAAKCAATKVQAAGKKAAAKLKCHANAVKKSLAVDGLCLGKAEQKFSDSYAKIEAKGGCTTTGDAASIEAQVDTLVGDVVTALPDGGTPEGAKCASTKIQSAGKKADAKLKCNAKAIGKALPVDVACVQKAEDKFSAAYVKVELKGGCATTGDAAAIEGRVDQLVQSVVSALSPVPTQALRVAIDFDPQVVTDLAAVELTLLYPTAKLSLPGSGNVPDVNSRVANLGPLSNSLQAADLDTNANGEDDTLKVVYGGADPTAVPDGDIARVTFDQPRAGAVTSDFVCTVTLAVDSLGLTVGAPVACTVTLE